MKNISELLIRQNWAFWGVVIAALSVFVSVITVIIYKKQLSISKQQTAISKNQNDPILIFISSKKENKQTKKNSFLFENIGHVAKGLTVYVLDEIFLSRDLSSGVVLFENAERLPVGINLRINGRFGESKPISLGAGNQRVEITEDNSIINIEAFLNELRHKLNCSVIKAHRVIMSYVDSNEEVKKNYYLLMNGILHKEDSEEYEAYDFLRENIVDYDIRLYNKNTIVDIIKEKLDDLN